MNHLLLPGMNLFILIALPSTVVIVLMHLLPLRVHLLKVATHSFMIMPRTPIRGQNSGGLLDNPVQKTTPKRKSSVNHA